MSNTMEWQYPVSRKSGTRTYSMHYIMESISSYAVALFVICMSQLTVLVEHTDTVLSVGGLVLLLIRFVADAPRAWRNIKKWVRRDD